MESIMLPISSSSVMPTLPTATPMQRTFFSWNLIVDLTSVTLAARSSAWDTGVGNLPATKCVSYETTSLMRKNLPLERPGPKRRGICLIKASEAKKASYLRASFLMSFLFLLSFFKSSADIASTPWCLARSISCWSPRTLPARVNYCLRILLSLEFLTRCSCSGEEREEA